MDAGDFGKHAMFFASLVKMAGLVTIFVFGMIWTQHNCVVSGGIKDNQTLAMVSRIPLIAGAAVTGFLLWFAGMVPVKQMERITVAIFSGVIFALNFGLLVWSTILLGCRWETCADGSFGDGTYCPGEKDNLIGLFFLVLFMAIAALVQLAGFLVAYFNNKVLVKGGARAAEAEQTSAYQRLGNVYPNKRGS